MTKKEKHNNQVIDDLISDSAGQGNLLSINRLYFKLTGDIKSAIFLSQCVYWSDRSSVGDGWFYKSQEEWQKEIWLTRDEIDRVKRDLCKKGLLEYFVRKAPNGAPTCYFKASIENIRRLLQEVPFEENPQLDMRETHKSICGKPTNGNVGNPQIDLWETHIPINSITKITTETTTKTTSSSSYLPQEIQNEEEEGIKISGELERLLEALPVFKKLWPEVISSGWNTRQLLELGYHLRSSNYANAGAIFVWRIRNQAPPLLASTHEDDDVAGSQDDFETECEEVADQIHDDVISAWTQTLDRIRLEVSQSIYVNCVEPIQLSSYNGSLELLLPNYWVKDKLISLNLTPDVISDYFSSFLGLPVPVQFVMS